MGDQPNAQQPVQQPVPPITFEEWAMKLDINEKQKKLDELIANEKVIEGQISFLKDCITLMNKHGIYSDVQVRKQAERRRKAELRKTKPVNKKELPNVSNDM